MSDLTLNGMIPDVNDVENILRCIVLGTVKQTYDPMTDEYRLQDRKGNIITIPVNTFMTICEELERRGLVRKIK